MQVVKGKGLGRMPSRMYHLWEFDSLGELCEFAAKNPDKHTSDRSTDNNFNLVDSFDEAHELAIKGWSDIRGKVDGHLEPMREKLGSILSTDTIRVHDMVGYEPDIDRYLTGELECMWEDMHQEAPRDGKVFTMVVDVSMTWDNSADDIAKRGAILCALVESFIMLGYQLELWSEFTVRGSGCDDFATCLTRINKAGDPIDIDCMMFALGHPDFGRRICWGWGEACTITREKMGFCEYGYYGYHRNGSHFQERIGASAAVSLDGNRSMTKDPINWILEQLEAQGVFTPESDFN